MKHIWITFFILKVILFCFINASETNRELEGIDVNRIGNDYISELLKSKSVNIKRRNNNVAESHEQRDSSDNVVERGVNDEMDDLPVSAETQRELLEVLKVIEKLTDIEVTSKEKDNANSEKLSRRFNHYRRILDSTKFGSNEESDNPPTKETYSIETSFEDNANDKHGSNDERDSQVSKETQRGLADTDVEDNANKKYRQTDVLSQNGNGKLKKLSRRLIHYRRTSNKPNPNDEVPNRVTKETRKYLTETNIEGNANEERGANDERNSYVSKATRRGPTETSVEDNANVKHRQTNNSKEDNDKPQYIYYSRRRVNSAEIGEKQGSKYEHDNTVTRKQTRRQHVRTNVADNVIKTRRSDTSHMNDNDKSSKSCRLFHYSRRTAHSAEIDAKHGSRDVNDNLTGNSKTRKHLVETSDGDYVDKTQQTYVSGKNDKKSPKKLTKRFNHSRRKIDHSETGEMHGSKDKLENIAAAEETRRQVNSNESHQSDDSHKKVYDNLKKALRRLNHSRRKTDTADIAGKHGLKDKLDNITTLKGTRRGLTDTTRKFLKKLKNIVHINVDEVKQDGNDDSEKLSARRNDYQTTCNRLKNNVECSLLKNDNIIPTKETRRNLAKKVLGLVGSVSTDSQSYEINEDSMKNQYPTGIEQKPEKDDSHEPASRRSLSNYYRKSLNRDKTENFDDGNEEDNGIKMFKMDTSATRKSYQSINKQFDDNYQIQGTNLLTRKTEESDLSSTVDDDLETRDNSIISALMLIIKKELAKRIENRQKVSRILEHIFASLNEDTSDTEEADTEIAPEDIVQYYIQPLDGTLKIIGIPTRTQIVPQRGFLGYL